MPTETVRILLHISNSGVVQLLGRRYPEIFVQGDTLSGLFDASRYLLAEFKRQRDGESYFETLMLAERLQGQLLHYEETLARHGIALPYTISVHGRLVRNDYAS